jgi:uncharacterized membrane protein YeaQ/YmgE (transglycosylase-associated protein family)
MNQTITLSFTVGALITWLLVGLIAGFLAGVVVRGRRFGFLTSVIVGLVGAVIGGFLVTALHIPVPSILDTPIDIRWKDIVVAFIGAVILLLVLGLFYRYRRP